MARFRAVLVAEHLRRFWITAGCFLAAVALFAAVVASGLGGIRASDTVDNLGQLAAPLVATVACAWAAWRVPSCRMAWSFMAASSLCWAMGQGVWCYYDLVSRVPVPFPSLADVGYLAAVPFAVVGLLSFPGRGWRATSRLRALTDGLLIAGSLLFVSWALVLGPIYGSHHGAILRQVLSMSYPASDVVLVSLVVVLALRSGQAGRTSLLLVMAGIFAFAVSDSSFAYLTEVNNYGVGGVLDTGWVVGYLLIVLGALWSMAMPSLPVAEEGTGKVTRFSVLAPYAVPALAGAVAMARLSEGHAFGLFLALEGFLLLVLLAMRQIITLLDNVTLNGLLHTKIELGTTELRQSEARFSALAEHSSDLITIVGEDSLIHYQSPSIRRTLGRDPNRLQGTKFNELLHPQDLSRWLAVVRRLRDDPQGDVTAELRLGHTDDTWRTFESVVTNLVDETSVAGYVVNSRDVTDQRGLEDQLRDQALHDPLTGLANRALFAEHLDRASRRQLRRGGSVQVMIIDLDNFGAINEEFGHAAGDELLTMVAIRLQTTLRDADSVARLGGDEFGILFEFPGSPPPSIPADRVVASFSKPFTVQGQTVRITSSIGVAANAPDCRSNDELLRRADLAMYAAKAQGKQTYAVYAPELHGSKLDGVRLDRDLRDAVERGEFELHYQPIVDIETGDIASVEALIRWNSPERGPVSPLEFIPAAESSGLIRPIGEWVIREACRETRAWRDEGGAPLRVSVNVSPQQLPEPHSSPVSCPGDRAASLPTIHAD